MAKKDVANTTVTFEKMGTSVVDHITVAPVIKGRSVPKTGNSKGGMAPAATANHRANIQEHLGAKGAPQVRLYEQNAAEASQVQRNTVIVPSKAGLGDFYMRSKYDQNT